MKIKIWSKRHVFTCLMGGTRLRVVPATKKESSEERLQVTATLTLRDGEVFYKKNPQKEFDWAKGKYTSFYSKKVITQVNFSIHPCSQISQSFQYLLQNFFLGERGLNPNEGAIQKLSLLLN